MSGAVQKDFRSLSPRSVEADGNRLRPRNSAPDRTGRVPGSDLRRAVSAGARARPADLAHHVPVGLQRRGSQRPAAFEVRIGTLSGLELSAGRAQLDVRSIDRKNVTSSLNSVNF